MPELSSSNSTPKTATSKSAEQPDRTSGYYTALIRRLQAARNRWADTVRRAIGVTSRGAGERLPSVTQFRATLERERSRSDRTNLPFSLIAFDLRRTRDLHKAMDELGRTLQQRLRVTDDYGLLAADCIGVVLPDTPARGAWKVVTDVCAVLTADTEHVICEVFEYPDTELQDQVGRWSDEALSSPDRPVPAMDELLCQPLPRCKRGVDILAASAGLVLLSPLFLAIGFGVRLSSSGPVFFRQQRSGRSGKPFTMFKFRSMVPEAESLKDQLAHLNERDGPAFKIKNDPRITVFGRFLRRTNIDELPQLWNVLKGEMSLVGPRPLPCDESVACRDWQRHRQDVTPGITCAWQVSRRAELDFEEWARMDIRYARDYSLWQDAKLLLKTPAALLRGEE